jgi:prephenate dehydrogenase
VRIAVIGVGLIGGSVGLAARQRLAAEVVGFDASPQAGEAALAAGALDAIAGTVGEAAAGADAVFVAAPVLELAGTLEHTLAAAPPDCVVTDVGSTKRAIVAGVDDVRFVGGHPLAGAESSGVRYARPDLFEGATWYLTPTETTSGLLYERLYRILHGFGARPSAIDADTHDKIMATVSHLPHVLANVLVSQAAGVLAAGDEQLPATGPSFRDATRVAGASSAIWTDIYLSNADALLDALDGTVESLSRVAALLREGDGAGLTDWNEAAAADRKRLLEAQLAGDALFELRASVPNRPGVIAQLALELGRGGVNITDLALHPAPDMSEGVVAVWVASEPTAARAQELIEGLGFPVSRP